jgi:hypothetical protein
MSFKIDVLRDLNDLDAYPILTEEVGYPPSPLSKGTGSSSGAPTGNLGQIALKAVTDVLGWKPKAGDANGFIGALTQSFTLTESEGHVDAAWTPRTYAVQSDLSGGISGAQASIYTRGKEALEQSSPLIDGLYPLIPDPDAENIAALKAVVKSQLTELVNELGMLGGPRVSRVNQYFGLLLGPTTYPNNAGPGSTLAKIDPDQILGTLGQLRDNLGLNFTTQDFVNTVADEQDLSNFRILSDYVTSLAQSWLNNVRFFGLNSTQPFFGTQLVLLSRQLSVVAESVDEVRFTLDSVFIGPAERQTLPLKYPRESGMFVEDLLNWIQSFASEEGPRLIQDGGKYGVSSTFVPIAEKLARMVRLTVGHTAVTSGLPRGFHTARVQRALRQLDGILRELVRMSSPIQHVPTPDPDFGLAFSVTGVEPSSVSVTQLPLPIYIIGSGFEAGATVAFTGGTRLAGIAQFRSDSLLVVPLSGTPPAGTYDVTVTNADTTTFTLARAFTVTA